MGDKSSLISFFANQYKARMQWQQAEFFIYGGFALSFLLCEIFGASKTMIDLLKQINIVFIQKTLILRLWSYSVDISNAVQKIGSAPIWLVSHHFGVSLLHYFVTQLALHKMTPLMLLAANWTANASSNTWTKKYSTFFYWANILIGYSWTEIYLNIHRETFLTVPLAYIHFAHFFIVVGVVLLAKETIDKYRVKNTEKSKST